MSYYCSLPNEQIFSHIMASTTCFTLYHHAKLYFYSASSVKQQYGRHVALLEHIILFLSHPVFALTAVCLAEKQQIPI